MAPEYKLTLERNDTGENVSVSGKFQDEDWGRLEAFTQYVEELLETEFVRNGMPASLNICWDVQSDLEITTKLPPWDDVTVFLHKFRPIGLKSESTYFYSICNILTKELVHPYLRNMIEWQREIYSGKKLQGQLKILSDNVVLNSEKVLYDWLNAYEYHRDIKKREFIDSLHTLVPLEASKVLFLALLKEKTIASCNTSALTRVLLGKQKSFEGALTRPV